MKKLIHLIYYWLPAIALMAIIFYLSAQPSVQVSNEQTVDFLAHKLVHVIMYAALYFLLFRGFYSLEFKQNPPLKTFIIPMMIAIAYGASDELHQTFVPTRTGTLRDVFIDSLGIVLMFQYTKTNLRRLKLFL